MLVIDKELLDGVTAQAKASPRLRMNYNLHDSLEAKAQRLMNAMEPGTDFCRFTAIPILQKRISFYAVESTCCFTVKMVSWKKAVNLTP